MDLSAGHSLIDAINNEDDMLEQATNAVFTFYEDMNSDPHHFLLELVQNADDVSYDSNVEPTFTLVLEKGLWIHCNETGFTEENVRAICRVRKSTKQASTEQTGEKGIGFKTVFGVAHTVSIASGIYLFKLHKSNPFKPEKLTLPFPDGKRPTPEGTTMYFELDENSKADVTEALETFQPTSIVFLKKLKRINITVNGSSKSQLIREEARGDGNTRNIKISDNNRVLLNYIAFDYRTTPSEIRPGRQSQTETTITLAFPLSEDSGTILRQNQEVYACLPVNYFGFRFAINADFVLTASREEIHRGLPWNHPFFGQVARSILDTIKRSSVLETETGEFGCPRDLTRVPDKYRIGPHSQRPPIPNKKAMSTYLSRKYLDDYNMPLELVGVTQMYEFGLKWDLSAFLSQLNGTDPKPAEMDAAQLSDLAWYDFPDPAWHNDLARMILKNQLTSYLSGVKLIPVEGGSERWASGSDNPDRIFLTPPDYDLNLLPRGIGLLFVPADAYRTEDRRRLYSGLGAKDIFEVKGTIADKIFLHHRPPRTSSMTSQDLISHALFLFKSSCKNTSPPGEIWVVTRENRVCLASETFAEPLWFDGQHIEVPLPHEDYLVRLKEEERPRLLKWMQQCLFMPESPRLFVTEGSSSSLSPEMKTIAEECDSYEFLKLLRQNWDQSYSKWLAKRNTSYFKQNIWDDIVSTQILCRDSERHPLRQTIFPSEFLDKHSKIISLPLLPIPKDDRENWGFLTELDVKAGPDADDWLSALQKLSRPTRDLVSFIYTGLEESCGDKQETRFRISEHFMKQRLIFVPPAQGSSRTDSWTWAQASQCIWFGPQKFALRHSFALSRIYDRNRVLFTDILNIKALYDTNRLWYEAQQLKDADLDKSPENLDQYITPLLLEISRQLGRGAQLHGGFHAEVEKLKKCDILPIRIPGSQQSFDRLITATAEDEWFIADDEEQLESLGTKVPLLALTIDAVRKSSDLLALLGLNRRRLSRISIASPMTQMTPEVDFAARWRARAKYIDRLALEGGPNERIALAVLQSNTSALDIYAKKGQLSALRTSMELASCICRMLRIPADRCLLIQYILEEDNVQDIERTLEEKKVPPLVEPESEDAPSREEDKFRDPLKLERPKAEKHHMWDISMGNQSHAARSQQTSRAKQDETTENLYGIAARREDPTQRQERVIQRQDGAKRKRDDIEHKTGTGSKAEPPAIGDGDKPANTAQKISTRGLPIRQTPLRNAKLGVSSTPESSTNPAQKSLNDEAINFNALSEKSEDAAMDDRGPKSELEAHRSNSQDRQNTVLGKSEQQSPRDSEKQDDSTDWMTKALQRTNEEKARLRARKAVLDRLSPARRLQESTTEELIQEYEPPTVPPGVVKEISRLLPLPQAQPVPPSSVSLAEDARESHSVTDNQGTKHTKPPPAFTLVRAEQISRETKEESLAHQRGRIIQQFSGSIEASIFVRQSQQTNIFYVAKPEDMPEVCHQDHEQSGTRAVFESRLRVPMNPELERSVYVLMPNTSKAESRDAEFLGQVWVSQLLSNHLGPAFDPEEHWRSPFCGKVYQGVEHHVSKDTPFQVDDRKTNGALTRFLIGNKYALAKAWQRQPPQYYIEVATTAHEHGDPVTIDSARFHEARRHRMRLGDTCPKSVFIFIRISNISAAEEGGRPKAAFYVDPWQLYTDNKLEVAAHSKGKHSVVFKTRPDFWVEHVEPEVYTWRPMPRGNATIRLFNLRNGASSDKLEGFLEYCDLNDISGPPDYTAISYTWGSALKQFSLHVTNADNNSPILLPASLYLALRRIRRSDRPTLIWADAICIDQNSQSEKTQQILLLWRIFRSAQRVLAWIGEEEEGSREAVKRLRNLGKVLQGFRKAVDQPDRIKTMQHISSDYLPRGDVDTWHAVRSLLRRAWFSRIWTVQEAILASDLIIVCGGENITWDVFQEAASFIFRKELVDKNTEFFIADETTQHNILHLKKFRIEAQERGFRKSDTMFTLLQLFHQRDVTKPRDRLFALLSLAKDKDDRLKPDYEASDEEIIMKYGAAFVEKGYALELLYQARAAWERHGLPSWMPKLTSSVYPKTVAGWGRVFRAGANVPDDKTLDGEKLLGGNNLCLHGYRAGKIIRLGNIACNTSNVVFYLADIFRFIDTVYGSWPEKERAEAKCRLPVGDALRSATVSGSWHPDSEEARREDAYLALVEYMDQYLETSHLTSEAWALREAARAGDVVSGGGDVRRRMWPYLQTVTEFAEVFKPASAVVCETDMGQVGIVAQHSAQVGDTVVIFRKAKVPYLIRESRPGFYQAVGECYIDGIMYGEVFNASKAQRVPEVDKFCLE
ncbi:hypothetical protein DL767_002742 [Monosporascus sp. MG133]|nr:hypothetical protein DL767_002742 [Monosporascus sp. MG133]